MRLAYRCHNRRPDQTKSFPHVSGSPPVVNSTLITVQLVEPSYVGNLGTVTAVINESPLRAEQVGKKSEEKKQRTGYLTPHPWVTGYGTLASETVPIAPP